MQVAWIPWVVGTCCRWPVPRQDLPGFLVNGVISDLGDGFFLDRSISRWRLDAWWEMKWHQGCRSFVPCPNLGRLVLQQRERADASAVCSVAMLLCCSLSKDNATFVKCSLERRSLLLPLVFLIALLPRLSCLSKEAIIIITSVSQVSNWNASTCLRENCSLGLPKCKCILRSDSYCRRTCRGLWRSRDWPCLHWCGELFSILRRCHQTLKLAVTGYLWGVVDSALALGILIHEFGSGLSSFYPYPSAFF